MATNKKLIKQIQSNPNLIQTIKNLQSMNLMNDDSLDLKDKLKKRIKRYQSNRCSSLSKEYQKEKKINAVKTSSKDETKDKEVVENILNTKISKMNKNRNEKLKLLDKKYGKIDDETYSNCIIKLQDSSLKDDDKKYYENIIALYNKQLNDTITFNKIDSGSDSE